jgi:hypothetical protein
MQYRIQPHTSSYTVQNEACVEAGATTAGQVAILDSKYEFRGEQSPILSFDRSTAARLLDGIKAGRYDL